MADHTKPSDATREAEARAATKGVDPGRGPTADEEAAAERVGPLDEGVAEHEREMNERGASQKGEGRV
jgi:hypothetical protein